MNTTRNEVCTVAIESSHLLVVDDIQMNRDLMAMQFRRNEFQVDVAGSGIEALDMIAKHRFDLVLLDLRMPGMDGLETLQHIRENHTMLGLPIIMVTAEDQESSIIESLQIGANDYLVKPISLPVALARINAQLTLSRLATIKDNVVRFASHDLKKPLLVMLDAAKNLQQNLSAGTESPTENAELVDFIVRSGHSMETVIDGFLGQETLRSEHQHTAYKKLAINDVVLRSFAANTDYAAHKGITLTHELGLNLPPIQASEFRIVQILDNLIGNALKFSPQGSQTQVSTSINDDCVLVEVIDSGPGFSDEDLEKLFLEPAPLSNRPTGDETSTGIGLNMCRQLISLDHGHIGACNNSQGGATFWITLPSA